MKKLAEKIAAEVINELVKSGPPRWWSNLTTMEKARIRVALVGVIHRKLTQWVNE